MGGWGGGGGGGEEGEKKNVKLGSIWVEVSLYQHLGLTLPTEPASISKVGYEISSISETGWLFSDNLVSHSGQRTKAYPCQTQNNIIPIL